MSVETAAREIPILFQGEMVRATREGRKTQTRRLRGLEEINERPDEWRLVSTERIVRGWNGVEYDLELHYHFAHVGDGRIVDLKCPFGQKGDRPWGRESFCDTNGEWNPPIVYKADGIKLLPGWKWSPSIHMFKSLCRLWLENTADPMPQRVQAISEADAKAEGCSTALRARLYGVSDDDAVPLNGVLEPSYRNAFAALWDSINGKKFPWVMNPWVWKVPYRQLPGTNGTASAGR